MSSLDLQIQLVNIPVSFGEEVDFLLGSCLENDTGSVLCFSLTESPLAGTGEGVGAAMSVFLELVMGRRAEAELLRFGLSTARAKTKLLCSNQVATPTSDLIWGEADIVCRSGPVFYMRGRLSCKSGLVMTGTALWSTAP